MEQWEKNYYITALAGANNGSSLVVMSKGKLLLEYPTYCKSTLSKIDNLLF
jgi:hypothetical protein